MIHVDKLSFTYPGNNDTTIKGINFSVEKGEIFGFLGPSGAGKSTTQKILIGILKAYQGNVQVMQQEVHTVNADYYESIGIAFEFPNFYAKLTALENLNFFRNLYQGDTERPEELLALVGLEKDGNTRVSEFSKGMKMRLNFCRSLMNKPDLIFLDEPTSGLDPVNVKKIKEIITDKQAQGTTICITTHDMHVADSLCDRVAFIVDGKLALIDSPRDLKLQHGERIVRLEYHENGSLQQADFDLQGLGENSCFQEMLNTKEIETIHTQEATLEDIFIQTTGRSLI